MRSTPGLRMGMDSFTARQLVRKAAEHKGLKLRESDLKARSETIREFVLDENLLASLGKCGITRQARPDCRGEIITLVDGNPQRTVPGWAPSNYWNFKLVDGDQRRLELRISLGVEFQICDQQRGIVIVPTASGTFVSPADDLPNFRMFRALVASDDRSPAVAKELAASDGSIVVTWTDLGLGGIRRLRALFAEFAGENTAVAKLGAVQEIFDPAPQPRSFGTTEELFIAEPAQPGIIRAWRSQLDEYRASLTA